MTLNNKLPHELREYKSISNPSYILNYKCFLRLHTSIKLHWDETKRGSIQTEGLKSLVETEMKATRQIRMYM